MKYTCTECGWTGEEEEVFIYAGHLWDYYNYDCCPECWRKDEEISLVKEVSEDEMETT